MFRITLKGILRPITTTGLIRKHNTIHSSVCRNFIRSEHDDSAVTKLFQPAPIKEYNGRNIGMELVGELKSNDVSRILTSFRQHKKIRTLCNEYKIDEIIQAKAMDKFVSYCMNTEKLPPEIYIKLYDICKGVTHQDDLFPYFLKHTKEIFPHLDCIHDLKRISDLSNPANWYPEARQQKRRIIFHGGPTNSGKTYQAMQRFLNAKSGIYCGPLKMLAVEVFTKSNADGTPCDLVTGEERQSANLDGTPANHVACTVEMAALNKKFEVAIIDEIQLLKDHQRGWAWSRALLGINADEVHVCGESGTLELLESIADTTGEKVEVNTYDRLTKLTIEDEAVESLDKLLPGDCIVCFNKNDLYNLSLEIENRGHEVAVIYGSLPPNTKVQQSAKFNDPNHKCKIMVATDAIGMGLNLSIRRLIFYSLIKPSVNEQGKKEIKTISVSSALQIAGRAGRYGTQWEHGYVTTFKAPDLPVLKYLLEQKPEPIAKAGLHPTAEQLEMYSYHLPHTTLTNILEIFEAYSKIDDLYFICDTSMFKYLSGLLEGVKLPLRARYVFCCAPIDRRMVFVTTMFSKFATQYSTYNPITYDYIAKQCSFPLKPPNTLPELIQLEQVFDVLDLYMWFSYRFIEMFPDGEKVKAAQIELDKLIQDGVQRLTIILKCLEPLREKDSPADDIPVINEVLSVKSEISNTFGGKVTARVLTEGLISADVLCQLHEEWRKDFIEKQKSLMKYKSMKYSVNNKNSAKDKKKSKKPRS